MRRGIRIGLWILVALVVVALFGLTAVRRLRQEEVQSIESVQAAEGIPVDVIEVRAIDLEEWRAFAGIAQGLEQVDLTADFRTRVTAVHTAVGDQVTAGEVLVSLDSYDPVRAQINLETARSQYETARADSQRIEELFKSGAASQQDLDHARAQCQAARALFLTARRAVEIDTPVAGTVTAVNVEPGDIASKGATMITVAALDRMRIPLELSGAEHARVAVGQPVRLQLDGASSGEYLYGDVHKVAISADPVSRLFPVELIVENPAQRLRPGALVTPEIRVAAAEQQLAVPTIALVERNGAEILFVLPATSTDHRVVARPVRRGIDNGALVAVENDLAPGDRVVVWGQNQLADGSKVKIIDDVTADYYPSER